MGWWRRTRAVIGAVAGVPYTLIVGVIVWRSAECVSFLSCTVLSHGVVCLCVLNVIESLTIPQIDCVMNCSGAKQSAKRASEAKRNNRTTAETLRASTVGYQH